MALRHATSRAPRGRREAPFRHDHPRVPLRQPRRRACPRSYWLRSSSLIDGHDAEDDLTIQILKTIAILNLLDAEDLLATTDVVAGALDAKDRETLGVAIACLKDRSLLYDRGTAGGYCL